MNDIQSNRPKVAFVVQRCGMEVNGGAEYLCRLVAERCCAFWDVEILTTTALDYVTWKEHYAPGVEPLGQVLIRRFSVDEERNPEIFDAHSRKLVGRLETASFEEQREWMRLQGPTCSALTEFIRSEESNYAAFVFFGYLYATTVDNLPQVAAKSVLWPLLHDEWMLRMSLFDDLFRRAAGVVFCTEAEARLAKARFFHLDVAGSVVGAGVEITEGADARRFRDAYGVSGPYLLYCGRIDESKGCRELVDQFIAWKRHGQIPHKLVMVGRQVMPMDPHPDILLTGFVSEEMKADATAGCEWLVLPSRYESLSFAVLEAFSHKRPVLVHGACEVLVDHCRLSGGGVAFAHYGEALVAIQSYRTPVLDLLGRNGFDYVRSLYSWEHVCARLRGAVEAIRGTS